VLEKPISTSGKPPALRPLSLASWVGLCLPPASPEEHECFPTSQRSQMPPTHFGVMVQGARRRKSAELHIEFVSQSQELQTSISSHLLTGLRAQV